jgi:hypothetical protein
MDSHITLTGSYEDRPGGSRVWRGLTPVSVEDFSLDESPWAWADYVDDEAERVDISAAQVTAVLVTLDAARWLPATLQALAKLDTRPTRLIAIDNASADATPMLLDEACRHGLVDAVYQGERSLGFGASVKKALDCDAANLQDDADTIGIELFRSTTPAGRLLHDDAVPAPDALYQLLAHATIDPSIDLTDPSCCFGGIGTAASPSARWV